MEKWRASMAHAHEGEEAEMLSQDIHEPPRAPTVDMGEADFVPLATMTSMPDDDNWEEEDVQRVPDTIRVSAGAPETSLTESALTDLIQRHIRNMPAYCEHTFKEARLLCTTTVAHTPTKLRQCFVSACMRDQVRAQEITMALHGTSGITTDTH